MMLTLRSPSREAMSMEQNLSEQDIFPFERFLPSHIGAASWRNKVTVEHDQNLVIGSSEAGKILAWNLAQMGQNSVVIERSMIGGSCPNVACLDTT
jgi:hypothetical protein